MLVSKLVAPPGEEFTVMRANDLDAISAFQSAISVQEQGKQTGVIQISLEDKNPEHAALVANALAQSYVRQHIANKQSDAKQDARLPEERRAAPRSPISNAPRPR